MTNFRQLMLEPLFCSVVAMVQLAVLFFISPLATAQTQAGEFRGAVETIHPGWFKQSFLDFRDDIDEAAGEGKRLLLYFWQHGCPYCKQLVDDNLAEPDIEQTVRAHFDLIAINMWGDRDVIRVDGQMFTEKTLAQALQVQFTPTLVFFDERGQVVLRLDGYHPPSSFRTALEYVYLRRESEGSFYKYLTRNQKDAIGSVRTPESFFLQPPYQLADRQRQSRRPLAIFFERHSCIQCDILHDQILIEPWTRQLIEQFDNILLNVASPIVVTTPSGTVTTAEEWAKTLEINYFPTIILFDPDGNEVVRIAAAFRTFHVQGLFDYVLSRAYLHEPSFQRYLSSRAERLREAGYDVDIWSYLLPVSSDQRAVVPD